MAPHSSALAWKIPWMEEPGGLQSMGLRRVWHDWATSLSLFTFMHWRRKWQPTSVFLLGESQGWGSLVGCLVYGVAQSQTRLKRLSSSSSCMRAKGSNMGTLYYLLIFICKYKTVLKNKAYGKKKSTTLIVFWHTIFLGHLSAKQYDYAGSLSLSLVFYKEGVTGEPCIPFFLVLTGFVITTGYTPKIEYFEEFWPYTVKPMSILTFGYQELKHFPGYNYSN